MDCYLFTLCIQFAFVLVSFVAFTAKDGHARSDFLADADLFALAAEWLYCRMDRLAIKSLLKPFELQEQQTAIETTMPLQQKWKDADSRSMSLWQGVDEFALSTEIRRNLAANGFRVGVYTGEPNRHAQVSCSDPESKSQSCFAIWPSEASDATGRNEISGCKERRYPNATRKCGDCGPHEDNAVPMR